MSALIMQQAFTDVKQTCLVFFGHGAPTKQQQQQSPDLKPYLTPHWPTFTCQCFLNYDRHLQMGANSRNSTCDSKWKKNTSNCLFWSFKTLRHPRCDSCGLQEEQLMTTSTLLSTSLSHPETTVRTESLHCMTLSSNPVTEILITINNNNNKKI